MPRFTLDRLDDFSGLALVDNKSILTATSGFLDGGETRAGFTHTVNVSLGCAFAHSLCGTYCYAQANHWITAGRPWGLYGFKRNIRDTYRRQWSQIKEPRRGEPKSLRIFMSTSCDPYAPQERRLRSTQALLEEMVERPPDCIVIQTRSPLVARDIDLIRALAESCEVWLSVTVETDMERIPGFPNHASPPRKRIRTLKAFRDRGILTQAAVSPLLPINDAEQFARDLADACDRIILDHFAIGDGSPGGLRTRRLGFPERLAAAGFGAWNNLGKLYEIKDLFDRIVGPERVLISKDGFNAVAESP